VPRVERLDSEADLKQLDRSAMLAVVAGMPEMLEQARQLAAGVQLRPVPVSRVIFVGMGGSAIAGDLAADLFYKKCPVPLTTIRNYVLPEGIDNSTLLIALSYSGETEETLWALKDAEKKGAQVVCITAGGKLREIAEAKKHPVYLVPSGYQPRAALPFLLVCLLTVLEKYDLIAPQEGALTEAIAQLQKMREEYKPGKPARTNQVKQLAKKLQGKIPLIFGVAGTTGAVAYRAKCQFNENSKQTALANVFPELNHNELVNIAALSKDRQPFALIVLRDDDDPERVKKRIEITKSLISRQLGGVNELAGQGKTPLARALSLIYCLDHLSVYLAILQGVDPTPVDVIGRLKKEMAR
jgi:glucose/mannose-6-phosphate isomerase